MTCCVGSVAVRAPLGPSRRARGRSCVYVGPFKSRCILYDISVPCSWRRQGVPAAPSPVRLGARWGVGCARANKVRQKWARRFSLARAPLAAAQARSEAPAGAPGARVGSESQYSASGWMRRSAARVQAKGTAEAHSRSEVRGRAQNLRRGAHQHHLACLPGF